MVILDVNQTLSEVKPALVSSCLRLLGCDISSQRIENCLLHDNFSGLTLDDIANIINYSNIVNFVEACKRDKCFRMTSNLAFAMANYLLRTLGTKTSFLNDKRWTPYTAMNMLERLFNEAYKCDVPSGAIKVVVDRLYSSKLLVSDMEPYIFMIVNYLLYNFKEEVVVFDDNDFFDATDPVNMYFGQFTEWVMGL